MPHYLNFHHEPTYSFNDLNGLYIFAILFSCFGSSTIADSISMYISLYRVFLSLSCRSQFSCNTYCTQHELGSFEQDIDVINLLCSIHILINHRRCLALGLYSLSGKTSYRQISWSLEAARLSVIMIVSHWNLTGISAALLPRCLSNFRAIEKV